MSDECRASTVGLNSSRYELITSVLVRVYLEDGGVWRELSSNESVFVHIYFDHNDDTFKLLSTDGVNMLINKFILSHSLTMVRSSKNFLYFTSGNCGPVYGLGFDQKEELLRFMTTVQGILKGLLQKMPSQSWTTQTSSTIPWSTVVDSVPNCTANTDQSSLPTTYSEEMNHVFGYSTNTAGVFDPILMPHCNVTPMKQQQQPYAIADHFGSPSLAASDSTVTFDGSVTTCIANPTFITSSTPTKTCGPIKQHFGSVPPARPSALIPHTGAMSVGRALQGSSVAKVPLFAPEGSSTPIPLFPNTTGPNETLASMPQRECTPLLGQPLNPIVEREWQGQSFIPTPQKEWTVAPSQLPTPVHQKEWPHQTQKWTANDWSQESPFINNMAQCAKAPLHLVQSISDERCKNVINSPIRSEIQSGTGTTMRDHRMMEIPRGSNSTDDGFYSGGRSSVVGTPDEFYQASVRQNAVEDGVSWRSSNTTDESSSMFAAVSTPVKRFLNPIGTPRSVSQSAAQTVASECAASGTLSSDANEDSVGGGYDIMSGLEKAIIDLSMLGLSDGDSTDINAKLN